jgi:hypothetical protein
MEPAESGEGPVCRRTDFTDESHVKVVRVGEAPLQFHETCMDFGVLFGRRDRSRRDSAPSLPADSGPIQERLDERHRNGRE